MVSSPVELAACLCSMLLLEHTTCVAAHCLLRCAMPGQLAKHALPNTKFLAVLPQENMGGLEVETAQITRLDGLGMDLVCTRKGQQIAVRVNYLRCSVHQEAS